MNEDELRNLLKNPQRILNLARVFHHLLHQLDKMEEEQAKQIAGQNKGVQKAKMKDRLEVVCKDKDGNIKGEFKTA